ncbi:hypothetical protein FBEOM_5157 [Fusarium beomiforme]|uniref:NACHT-NTPase and P-loop NTPases N-terminal domain-containing protein n=1 Tax=Fusarium beomiforme TaxID=44412 RepID=A0A9P5ALQ0_9HYPO|nr:hypothetical protein FBEOM_5157 [Fusarium beomiforme]
MSGAEVLGVISGAITVIEATITLCKIAKDSSGLPPSLRDAASRLPLIQDSLTIAAHGIQHDSQAQESYAALETVLQSCSDKAIQLHQIFEAMVPQAGATRTHRYLKAVKSFPQVDKANVLVEGILGDLQVLTLNHVVKAATREQIKELMDTRTRSTGEGEPTGRSECRKQHGHAEIAAFKAMEEKAAAAEKRKEAEAQIREEAEEAFYRRMEDMKLAQEEAKKEIETARIEAEKTARERMETERKVQEKRAEEHARAKAEAERAALERLRAEQEAEEERSKRFKEAELAEKEAMAKQNADLERLAKSKMIQSMDEIVSLTKKRVLHDSVTDGESIGSKERQGWLIETRNEADAERSVLPTEKGHLTAPRSGMPPRHATCATVNSASSASIKLPGVSPTPSWKDAHPEAPDPWGSGSESDDEGAPTRAETNTLHPAGSNQRRQNPRRSIFERQQKQREYEKANIPHIEDLVDQIADAVMERLMHSPYSNILMHRPQQTGRNNRRHMRPTADPLTPAPNPFPSPRRFADEGNPGYSQGPPACGPSARFYRPPKPERLRGRSLRGSTGAPSIDLTPHAAPSSQEVPIPTGKGRSSPQPGPPPLEDWLNSGAQYGSQTSYSEVDTVTQETSTVHGVTPDNSETPWKKTEPWIQDVVSESEDADRTKKTFSMDNLDTYLAGQKNGDSLEKAYKYVFQDEPVPASLPIGVGVGY